jgi:hypothetical protein
MLTLNERFSQIQAPRIPAAHQTVHVNLAGATPRQQQQQQNGGGRQVKQPRQVQTKAAQNQRAQVKAKGISGVDARAGRRAATADRTTSKRDTAVQKRREQPQRQPLAFVQPPIQLLQAAPFQLAPQFLGGGMSAPAFAIGKQTGAAQSQKKQKGATGKKKPAAQKQQQQQQGAQGGKRQPAAGKPKAGAKGAPRQKGAANKKPQQQPVPTTQAALDADMDTYMAGARQ